MARTSGTYNNLDNDHGKHNDCVAEALKKCLPKAYAALYYLYFMGNKSLSGIQGGQWHDYACNGTYSTYGRGSKVELYLWLTDVNGSGTGLVRRGFPQDKHSFTNKKGSDVATAIANIISHESPAALQNVLCGFMFVCSWDPSLLGHALAFISKFCSEVSAEGSLEGKLKGYSGKLKTVCHDLQRNLQPFINGSVTYIQAVCHQNTNLFKDLWDDEHFDSYVSWLRKNLKNIIDSLKAMSRDCKQWTKKNLQSASSAGPSRFGFVFKDNKWEDQTFKNGLSRYTSPLTAPAENSGSLNELKECLEPSSSAGATAGGVTTGVLGAGGLGFGAAYATNAFGFQNFISGLISSFLK